MATRDPAYFVIDDSSLTSLHLSIGRHGAVTVGLHVENLFNGFEPLSGQAFDSNLIQTDTAAQPRTVRLTLSSGFRATAIRTTACPHKHAYPRQRLDLECQITPRGCVRLRLAQTRPITLGALPTSRKQE